MKLATFLNFTDKPFTAKWNGKDYTFKPGQKKEHLNSMIVATFAKHLANQVLTESNREQYCSPKKPLEVPEFMKEFNKAFFIEGEGRDIDPETGLPADGAVRPDEVNGPSMNIRTVPRAPADPYDANAGPQYGPGGKPQVIGTVTDDEESFEGKDESEDGEVE